MESKDYQQVINRIKHYLPHQNPLKDFIHHNTLHAFQNLEFHEGLQKAAKTFGYQVYLPISAYRDAYQEGKIGEEVLNRVITETVGSDQLEATKLKLLHHHFDEHHHQQVGRIRQIWKEVYKANPDKKVYPLLFRTIGNFLDQGIAAEMFPFRHLPFLEAIRTLESESMLSLFKTKRARKLLLEEENLLPRLLDIVVGSEEWVEHYLFDQQFAHPGWSGMVSVIEDHPNSLVDPRKVSLHDFICFELLLEIDALDGKFGEIWKPISLSIPSGLKPKIFDHPFPKELYQAYQIWQEAFEWSYYDQVLRGLSQVPTHQKNAEPSFQAIFCIDDREGSFRRHIEGLDPHCETFGTAGFFNIPMYFQAESALSHTKVCPAPMKPRHLIKEVESSKRHHEDILFNKKTHGLLGGLASASTVGFWSAVQMGWSILSPSSTAAMVSSARHMDQAGKLVIEHKGEYKGDLQVGFTIPEMVNIVSNLLQGIGLTKDFGSLVYLMGHGASSTNNTHYAGYDCGACSGRSGSANARIGAYMANHAEVRTELRKVGIDIPAETQFVGALHDTTRDEAMYYDEEILSDRNKTLHAQNVKLIEKALQKNAVERSRRFLFVDSTAAPDNTHKKVKRRSVSLFEPRPEWNHATNALCIVGKRSTNKNLFLDRRAFLNSYDEALDPSGDILLSILNAVAPVCGGINLEYYFSKVDNYRLGAGSKLPHNVVGLIGVSNGMDGDLRPGLPLQMVNIHDPMRLLLIIEQEPEKVAQVLDRNHTMAAWFQKGWIHLAAIHPHSKKVFVYKSDRFIPYQPLTTKVEKVTNLEEIIANSTENLPVFQIS